MHQEAIREPPLRSDLPAKVVASGVFIGNIIIGCLILAGLSMVLAAAWLAAT